MKKFLIPLLPLLMLMALPGCMTVKYKELTITKFAWETKIGHLEASDGQARIVIENYDSQSQAIELAKQAITLVATAKAK